MPGDPRAKFHIIGDNSDYRRALKESKRDTETFASSIGSALKFGAVAGAAAVTGAALAIRSLTAEATKNADALAKQSDKLGIATERLAALQLAGRLTGVENDKLTLGLQRMTRRIAEAAQGSGEAKGALAELGLSAQDLARQSLDEQFRTVAEAMGAVDNQSDRIRLGFKLFDSEGVDLIRTLDLVDDKFPQITDEAVKFGIALSRVDARQIERANDAVVRANTATQGIATNIALAISPIREGLANAFSNAAAESQGFKAEIQATMEALIIGANFGLNAIRGVQLALKGAKLAALSIQEAIADKGKNVAVVSGIAVFGEKARKFNEVRVNEIRAEIDAIGANIDALVGKFKSGDAALADFRASIEASRAAAAASLETTVSSGGEDDAAGPTFFSDDQRAQLAARLAALQSTLQSETEAIIAAREERLALLDEADAADISTFEERENLKLRVYQEAADKLLEIDQRRIAQQQAIEQHHQDMIVGMRSAAVNAAVGLLQTLGQRSKTLARAAIVVEKAIAVSRIIINTNIAAAKALAELGPIAGPPAAASITAWGYGLAAATAAMGVAQLATSGGSAGPAIGGGASASISSSTDNLSGADAENAYGPAPRSVTNVHIAGSLLAGQDTLDSLKNWIRDLTDADEVIISNNSRQAAELRGVT